MVAKRRWDGDDDAAALALERSLPPPAVVAVRKVEDTWVHRVSSLAAPAAARPHNARDSCPNPERVPLAATLCEWLRWRAGAARWAWIEPAHGAGVDDDVAAVPAAVVPAAAVPAPAAVDAAARGRRVTAAPPLVASRTVPRV